MEMPAKQAREITDKHEQFSNEIWYSNLKDVLFEDIKNEALKGNNSITLPFIIKCTKPQREYLMSKLTSLGYAVNYEINRITIEW